MQKQYKIADVKLTVDIWKNLPEYERLEAFKTVHEVGEDVYVRVRMGGRVKKDNMHLLKETENYSLYTDGESSYRFYTDGLKGGYGEYACTTIKNGQCSHIESVVFDDSLAAVPSMGYVLDIIPVEAWLLEHKRLLLHASYIVYNGKAILFTAKCGVGKSTQARLWNETLGADIVNGDRVIIGRDENGILCAYGSPYCGSSNICKNITAPIAAIVVLAQAKENTVVRLSQPDAFKRIYSELTTCNAVETDVAKTIDAVLEIVNEMPIHMLSCTPDARAVYALKNEIETELF